MGRGGGGELVGSEMREDFFSRFKSGLRDFFSRVAGGRVRLDCRLFSSGCTDIQYQESIFLGIHKSNIKADLEYLLGERHIIDELCFVNEFHFDVFVLVDAVGVVAARLRQNHMYLHNNAP